MDNIKVYNENKTEELQSYDLSLGYLIDDILVINHEEIIGQEEEGHYETVAEYENGGKDVQWIIDKPYIEHKEAWIESIPIKVYIEYTQSQIRKQTIEKDISEIKEELAKTDYKTLKYVDGLYTEEEYEPIKTYRQELRNQINLLEEELNEL